MRPRFEFAVSCLWGLESRVYAVGVVRYGKPPKGGTPNPSRMNAELQAFNQSEIAPKSA
jgi:hypothetical protein